MNVWATQKGFTIVELLITIVVIAILASITVVGYSGIQERARSAAWVSALSSWEQVFRLYKVDKGNYYNTGGYLICLGTNYPAADGFAQDQCYRSVPSAFLSVSTSAALNAEINTLLGSVPSGVVPTVKNVDPAASNREGHIRGLIYSSDGTTTFIEYYLDSRTGSSGCIGSDTVEYAAYADASKRCRRYLT